MLLRIALPLLMVAVGVASFYGAQFARSAFADTPATPDITEVSRLLVADEAKPRMNRVFNGISVSPHGEGARTPADQAESRDGVAGASANPDTQLRSLPAPCPGQSTRQEVDPAGDMGELAFTHPDSWLLGFEEAISCNNRVILVHKVFSLKDDWEGEIDIKRIRGAIMVKHDAAAERTSGITVAGKAAVHFEPVRTSSGFAIEPEVLAVTESWGITIIEVRETAETPSARQVAEAISGGN